MKLCLIGRILSIIAAASIYQSVHRFVYCCKNAYISPKKQLGVGGCKSSGCVGLEVRQEMQSYGSH